MHDCSFDESSLYIETYYENYYGQVNISSCNFKKDSMARIAKTEVILENSNIQNSTFDIDIPDYVTIPQKAMIKNCTFTKIKTETTLWCNLENTKCLDCVFKGVTTVFFDKNAYVNNCRATDSKIFTIYVEDNSIISDCIFDKNTGSNTANLGIGNNCTVTDCIFKNSNGFRGGSLEMGSYSTVKNCIFINNYAVYGGAIWTAYAENSVIDNCSFINNTASHGGAICWEEGSVKITNSIFDNNKLKYVEGYGNPTAKNIVLEPHILSAKSKCSIELVNNFWGFNNPTSEDAVYSRLTLKNGINKIYANIKLEKENGKYKLSFVNNNNQKIKKMPNYTVKVKDKATNKIIAKVLMVNGEGTFTYSKSITVSDVDLLNNANGLINKYKAKASAGKVKTTYDSGKSFKIKLLNSNKKAVKGVKFTVKVNTGKLYNIYYATTNKNGIATLKVTKLDVGTYDVEIYSENAQYEIPKTTSQIKITKAKTTVTAPKVTNKLKKSANFKITIKNKATKKAVKKAAVNLKIDKKTYKVKTNSKGQINFNTKSLTAGNHKVSISSGSGNYQINAKSTITIKR